MTGLPDASTAHVETWAFADGCSEGAGASDVLIRQWVTFAETNCGVTATKARDACHVDGRTYCEVMQYLDTNWDYVRDQVPFASAASPSWWLHQPGANQGSRIYGDDWGGGYAINQLNPEVQAFFHSYVRQNLNDDDGFMMDWEAASLGSELYYSTCGCSTTSEISSDAMLRTGHEEMSAALTHTDGSPFIQAYNSLASNPWLPQGFDMLNSSTGVDGWVAESEPEDYGVLDPYYSTLLDQIAYITDDTSGFIVLHPYAAAGASSQLQSRRVQEATTLLGYSPGHVVDWADLEVGDSSLAVWPEEGIYPTDPLQSMGAPGGSGCLAGGGKVCTSGGHNDIEVAPGVYRREFGECYHGGARFGPCAAIVNTSSNWMTVRSSWLSGSYGHFITFNGGDVQSGGSLNLAGGQFAAGSTPVPPGDALLLAP